MLSLRLVKKSLAIALLCFTSAALAVNQAAISNPGDQWLSYGRDYSEQRYSPLDQINADNLDQLNLAWSFKFDTARAMEATPLVHNGVIYISTGWSHVYALDAKTGQQLWHYDAKVPKSHLVKACCGPVNRGVALWQGKSNGALQIFFGALDGRLIALDAITGNENWSVQTTPVNSNYSITGAPRVVKGQVIIGNGGAELGVRGYITAYDVNTGEQKWRFYTVPGDPNKPQEQPALERALKTWGGDQWYQLGGGGGTVWDAIVYDPQLDLLYIGTGNGSPWNRELRSPGGGDNLYLSSIVALNPDSGEYVWHYQTTPADNWDYTATQQLVLADLTIDGEVRKVIMQAPKNGFFYVLDRRTGELLSADKFAKATWASHVDMETGRPVETKYADYQSNGGSYIWPAPVGAHNWQPMSYSTRTGLMYIPVINSPFFYAGQPSVDYKINRWNVGIDLNEGRDPKNWVAAKAGIDALAYGELVAWDPIKKQRAWSVRQKMPSNGGVLSTAADLVFQGTWDGTFAAYDAHSGENLWQYRSDSAVMAGPITYELEGEQYIAVAQGGGGGVMLGHGEDLKRNKINNNRLLVFKLGNFGLKSPVADQSLAAIPPLNRTFNSDANTIKKGETIYGRNCSFCHSASAKSNYIVPDLRYMSEQTHNEFTAIVLGGSRSHKGMIGFYETLDFEDVEAVHAYLAHQQQMLPEKVEMSFWQKIEYWFYYFMTKIAAKFPDLLNASRDMLMQ